MKTEITETEECLKIEKIAEEGDKRTFKTSTGKYYTFDSHGSYIELERNDNDRNKLQIEVFHEGSEWGCITEINKEEALILINFLNKFVKE